MPSADVQRSKGFRLIDFIHLVGSIASITGVSLLWIKDSLRVPSTSFLLAIPVLSVATLLSLGLASLAYMLVKTGYDKFVRSSDPGWKVTYLFFSIAAAFLVYSVFAATIWIHAVAFVTA
jgi:hypothetical protein